MAEPSCRPKDPRFGSGPTRKICRGLFAVGEEILGISHRSRRGLALIHDVLERLRSVLQIPETYEIGLVSGGCTGAMEFLLWNLLGAKPVDVLTNGVFGNHWVFDVEHELKVPQHRVFSFPVGEGLDFSECKLEKDAVFVWTETPSGTTISRRAWDSVLWDVRTGLTICDATAAMFCEVLPWKDLDATAFSWQKGLGGEAGLGTVILSPRAQERLATYVPPWPRPRFFRPPVEEKGEVRKISSLFWQGHTINTVSLAVVQDMVQALTWVEAQGGLAGLVQRVQRSARVIEKWTQQEEGFNLLVKDPAARAKNVACIEVWDPVRQQKADWDLLRAMVRLLEEKGVALDILNHTQSVPCLRLWLGPVVEESDVEALLPWLAWARNEVVAEF